MFTILYTGHKHTGTQGGLTGHKHTGHRVGPQDTGWAHRTQGGLTGHRVGSQDTEWAHRTQTHRTQGLLTTRLDSIKGVKVSVPQDHHVPLVVKGDKFINGWSRKTCGVKQP